MLSRSRLAATAASKHPNITYKLCWSTDPDAFSPVSSVSVAALFPPPPSPRPRPPAPPPSPTTPKPTTPTLPRPSPPSPPPGFPSLHMPTKSQIKATRNAALAAAAERGSGVDGKHRMVGKVGVITGVGPAQGIGTKTARLFAREGARHVYLLDVSKDLPAFAKKLQTEFPQTKVSHVVGDAASTEVVKGLVEQVMREEERLDFFFANAGVSSIRPKDAPPPGNDLASGLRELQIGFRSVREHPDEDFTEVMRINAFSGFLAIKYAGEAMEKAAPAKGKNVPGGSLVLTASVAGLMANAGPLAYSASKAAVASMAKSAAYELTGTNVRVNAICPGLIQTDMTQGVFATANATGRMDNVGVLNPLQRQGLPDEVASLALWLASDDSSYVNGQAIAVDGGLTASMPYQKLPSPKEDAKL